MSKVTLDQINKFKYVEVMHMPGFVKEAWEEELEKPVDNQHLSFRHFPEPRILKNAKDEIKVYGCLRMVNGNFAVSIDGPNCDKVIKIFIAGYNRDTDSLNYYAFYGDPDIEQQYSKYVMTPTMAAPLTGVGAILYRYDTSGEIEFLLARRIKGPSSYLGKLSNFGGAVDLGESLGGALIREIFEETGIIIKENGLSQNPHHFDNSVCRTMVDDAMYIYHAISYTYEYNVGDQVPENKEPHKCEDFAWYKASYVRLCPDDFTELARTTLIAFLHKKENHF